MRKYIKNNTLYFLIQVFLFIGLILFLTTFYLKTDGSTILKESKQNMLNFLYCFLLSFLPIIFSLFHFKLSGVLKVYYIFAVIVHFILGGTFHLYNTKYFSFIVHFVNSFFIGVIISGILLRNNKKQGRLYFFFTCFACVVLVGALWEIVEFIIDNLFNGNMQKTINPITLVAFVGKRAIYDTMFDICMDVLGGICAGLFAYKIKIKNKPLYCYFELKNEKIKPKSFGEIEYVESVANISETEFDNKS